MLYKIITGNGVPKKPQDEIIYLCSKFVDFTTSNLKWCYTNGNAAKYITEFYNTIEDIQHLDWHSIESKDWADNNSDGDHDRMRKKQAEFLVKDHVPVQYIKAIVVLTEQRKLVTDRLVQQYGLNISVHIDKENKFYY